MKKIDRKESRVTVRLTPHQNFELTNITNDIGISKAGFIRYLLEQSINNYYEVKERASDYEQSEE